MFSNSFAIGAAAFLIRTAMTFPVVSPLFPNEALMPDRDSIGTAHILNHCDFAVFYANVPEQGRGRDAFGMIQPGENYTVGFDSPQIGHSIKLSLVENDLSDILQFEYSTTMDMHIDYDVSIVDGSPFDQYGFSLDADQGCPAVECEVPVDGCMGVYVMPFGNMDPNFYCWLSAHIGLTLCRG